MATFAEIKSVITEPDASGLLEYIVAQPKARRATVRKQPGTGTDQEWINWALNRINSSRGRNEAGFQLVRRLWTFGIPRRHTKRIMLKYQQCVPPSDHEYTKREALATLDQIYDNPSQGSKSASHENESGSLDLTDSGMARRFAAAYEAIIRYCPEIGKWLIFDSIRWIAVDDHKIHALVKKQVQQLYQEARAEKDPDRSVRLLRAALKYGSYRNYCNIISAAKSEPELVISIEKFDKKPYLLTVRNGTIDLRTGTLLPHNKEDYITKCVNADYDPDATSHLWEKTVRTSMGDNEESIRFVRKALGYAAAGYPVEQVLFVLHGPGANGKTTIMATVLDLFGDYSHSFSAEVLTKDWSSNQLVALSEIAQAKGARIVESSETGEGKKLAEALVKRMTGNDSVTAKFYHQDPFSYIPQFVLFVVTNHKPEISGTDEAIWRRIKYVPFNVSIPAEKQDKKLLQKLKAEYSGILTWIVKGCLLWQKEGLGDPPEIAEAKASYRWESDVIGQFLDDKCRFDPNETYSSGKLYNVYKDWCSGNGLDPISSNQFSPKLEQKGLKKKKATSGELKGSVVWQGIGIKISKGRK